MGLINALEMLNTLSKNYWAYRKLRKDSGALTRLLYLECKRNIAILSCLKLENTKNIKNGDASYLAIAPAIETDILESVFLFGNKNHELFDIMIIMDSMATEDNAEDDEEVNGVRTPMKALVYLYIKTAALKKLSQIDRGKAFKNIYFRERLKNIRNAYSQLCKELAKHKEVQKIL